MHQVKVRHPDQNFHQPPAALLTTKTCSDYSDEGSDDNENQEKKELKNSRQHKQESFISCWNANFPTNIYQRKREGWRKKVKLSRGDERWKKQYFSQFLKTLKNKWWRDLTKKSSFYADQSLDLLVFFPKNIYPKKGGKAREQKLHLLREMKDKKKQFLRKFGRYF